jgi:endonuclease/exonuclease/phosphatase (EEP) superfamily protein YafD
VDQPQRPHSITLLLASLAALVGIAAGTLYLFPQLQTSNRLLALASSFLPYGVVAWLLAAVILFSGTRGRARWLATLPVAGMLAHSLMFAAYFDRTYQAPAGTEPTLRLMSLNMRYGQADLGQLLGEVERVRPDVLVLTEFTSQAEAVLTAPDWRALLPYHVGTTGDALGPGNWGDASGTQVLSRTPLTELERTEGTRATSLAVRVTVAGRSFALIAAHPANAVSEGLDGWLRESREITDLAKRYSDGPLLVAGDLNSVPEHYSLRTLLAATGLHECLDGWQPTYPGNRLVALIRIDHVLASAQFRTVSMDTFAAQGSDHRGVVAELARS